MIVFFKKQFKDISQKGIHELKKKILILLKFISLLPFYFLGFLCCLLIRLLRPIILIRIDSLPSNFGDCALWTFHYYSKKKLRIDEPNQFFKDFIFAGARYKESYNSQLLKMWKRKTTIYGKYPLHFIYTMNKFLPGWQNHTIKNLSQRPVYGYKNNSNKKEDQIEYLINKSDSIKFTKEEEIFGDKLLRDFGVDDKKKIVCFAIRDHSYSRIKLKDPNTDSSYHSYRHTNLKNFELAAKFLADKGYYVFRMGRKASEKFNLNDKRIIDYSNSNLKNDFLDVFIGANCYFCLSTGYGFDDIPLIFGRPLALISTPIIGIRSRLSNQIFLTKHHFCREKKDNLTLDEIFKKNVYESFYSNEYLEKDIDLNDNSPEEIKELAIEMTEVLKSDFNKFEESSLQLKFKEKFLKNLNRLNENTKTQLPYQTEVKGRFSKYFLEKNKTWLS